MRFCVVFSIFLLCGIASASAPEHGPASGWYKGHVDNYRGTVVIQVANVNIDGRAELDACYIDSGHWSAIQAFKGNSTHTVMYFPRRDYKEGHAIAFAQAEIKILNDHQFVVQFTENSKRPPITWTRLEYEECNEHHLVMWCRKVSIATNNNILWDVVRVVSESKSIIFVLIGFILGLLCKWKCMWKCTGTSLLSNKVLKKS